MSMLDARLVKIGKDAPSVAEMTGPSIGEIYENSPINQRDLIDLVVGAAVEDVVLPTDMGFQNTYDGLSDDQKNVLHFVVGNALSGTWLADNFELMDDDDFDVIEHYGTKGMRWGVRKGEITGVSADGANKTVLGKVTTATLRAKVKAGEATLEEAHLAALKSKGHRVLNGVLGDKTYWKRQLVIAGAVLAGVALSVAAPAAMPVALLAKIGASATASAVASTGVSSAAATATAAALGAQTVTTIGVFASGTAGRVATLFNIRSNTTRAISGNKQINQSMAALGENLSAKQTTGLKKTQQLLNRAGSISKSALTPEGRPLLREVRNELNSRPDSSLPPRAKAVRDKLNSATGVTHSDGGVMDEKDKLLETFDRLSPFDALEHFGVRGMKWGIRRNRDQAGGADGKAEKDGVSRPQSSAGSSGGKGEDGSDHVAADVERFVKTHQKAGYEMSDREIKEATQRAKLVKEYNSIFTDKPETNAELKDKLEKLELQRDIGAAQAAMRGPGAAAKISNLIVSVTPAFQAVVKLDQMTGNAMSGALKEGIGIKPAGQKPPASEPTVAQRNAAPAKTAGMGGKVASAGAKKAFSFARGKKAGNPLDLDTPTTTTKSSNDSFKIRTPGPPKIGTPVPGEQNVKWGYGVGQINPDIWADY